MIALTIEAQAEQLENDIINALYEAGVESPKVTSLKEDVLKLRQTTKEAAEFSDLNKSNLGYLMSINLCRNINEAICELVSEKAINEKTADALSKSCTKILFKIASIITVLNKIINSND